MRPYLLIDIGAGTMDILYYDIDTGLHYKAVVKSPVLTIAEKIKDSQGDLLVQGVEMGGGSVTEALKERVKTNEVVMSFEAAATIHHEVERVQSHGFRIEKQNIIEELKELDKYSLVNLSDLEMDRIRKIVNSFGVPFSFQAVGICAQDHGMPPKGMSHLDFRHNKFKSELDKKPLASTLLYKGSEVPESFNRLKSIAQVANQFPTEEIYVMDSGMAAILGASLDQRAIGKKNFLVLDIATSHTVGAAIDGDEIAGFFEYHTKDISANKIDNLLKDLCNGNLDHEKILSEGGHGAYIRKAFGFDTVEIVLATGPKRRIMKNSQLQIEWGTPLGDNMMTGTTGLLEAVRRRDGLKDIDYC